MIHPSEDELETYLLRGIAGPSAENDDTEAAVIEEHLLFCCLCLEWVQAQEQTIRVMRECLQWPVVKRQRKAKLKVMSANQGWLF